MIKNILVVVSEIGFTWDEVILPYIEFSKEGFEVTITTPQGNIPRVDPLSIKILPILNLVGFGTSFTNSPDSEKGRELRKLLEKPLSFKDVQTSNYQALYIAGGHGSLFDLNKNPVLHKIILAFDQEKKPIGIICHAVSTLAFIKKKEGSFLQNRNTTGFPTLWEKIILLVNYIHPSFVPLPIWTGKELNKHATGRTLITKILELINPYYVVLDGNLVTGVGPKAGGNLAQKMIFLLR